MADPNALLEALNGVAVQHRRNPAAERTDAYGQAEAAVLGPAQWETARAEIGTWPGYAATPLVNLPGLAGRSGIARLAIKDESSRFGLGSFKALGGAYAVLREVKARIAAETGTAPSTAEIVAGRHAAAARTLTVCSATDGNHGRSVAWGAQMFGPGCVIYIHETVSRGREAAIARFGAEVRRVPGTYDDSVRAAARDAAANGWAVISDTSYDGYTEVPRHVMAGYTVMAAEALEQWGAPAPTHVFVQAGVGALAAAVCGYLWAQTGARRPRFVIVEPEKAACLFESARQGHAATVGGELDTMMAGLAAGETSLIAWDLLGRCVDDFLTVPDTAVPHAMRLLAAGVDGDPPVVAGESAVAGLAALLACRAHSETAEALGLDDDSRVLLFSTEGDTDPDVYREIVGHSADAVRARGTQ